MPKGKRNVNAYGKSWSPIDLPNLEKAIKLYERLNYLQDHFANSLSGSHNIMQQINETQDIQNELQKLGIKLTKEQSQEVANSIKEIIKNSNKIQGSTYGTLTGKLPSKNPYDKKPSPITYSRPDTSVLKQKSFEGYFKNAGDIYNTINQNKLYDKALNAEAKRLKASGSIMSDSSIQKVAEINLKNGKMGNEASKLLYKSANKFNKGADVIQLVSDTLLAGLKTVFDLFKSGIDRQAQVYEETFTNVAARNDISKREYLKAQNNIDNELGNAGVFNSIRSSDIMQMWDTFATQGMFLDMSTDEARAELTAKAIDTVVTQKIVPYLNSSDEYFQSLVDQQPQLMKQVRGIGKLNQDLTGTNTMTNKYLQDMVDKFSPVARLAQQELGVQYAKATGAYDYLKSKHISDYAIGESYGMVENIQRDLYGALQSNDLDTKLTAIRAVTDENIDLANTSDLVEANLESVLFTSNMPGDLGKGKKGLFYQSMTPTTMSAGSKFEFASSDVDMDELKEIMTGINKDSLNAAAESMTNNFGNNKYTTTKEYQEITMENIANQFSIIKQELGHGWDVLTTAINGIGTFLVGSVIGKGIGALVGIGSGGAGKGILASSGGIALGTVGTVAASAALVAAIGAGIYQADQKNKEESAKTAEENFKNSESPFTSSESAGKFVSGAGAELNTDDLNGWGKFMRSAGDAIDTWGLGIRKGWTGITNFFDGKKGWTDTDYVGKNAQYWNSIVANGLRDFNSDEDRGGYYAAYAFLLDQVNSLESTNKMGEPITKDDLKALFTTVNPDTGESLFKHWSIDSKMSYFLNWNLVPTGEDGTKANGDIDYANVYEAPKGSYRIGLNRVPYDNYPALLHENETVLTASTANELRNLTDTYRETSQQSISFDTIIQSQTDTLCAKLDQVISTIQGSIYSKEPSTSWNNNTVLNNMKHLKNLNAFNN